MAFKTYFTNGGEDTQQDTRFFALFSHFKTLRGASMYQLSFHLFLNDSKPVFGGYFFKRLAIFTLNTKKHHYETIWLLNFKILFKQKNRLFFDTISPFLRLSNFLLFSSSPYPYSSKKYFFICPIH